jgi:3-oxoacyl-[acyl-carrier-protein] synthase II
MNKHEVVVTGLGVVSSLGIGRDDFWRNLTAGKSGIKKVTLFDTAGYNRHYAGEINDFDAGRFINKKTMRFFGRSSQFAIAATKLALEDASLGLNEVRDAAIILGTTIPEGSSVDRVCFDILRDKAQKADRNRLFDIFSPSIAQNVGYFFQTKGINTTIPCACAAGNYAIGHGFDLIKGNRADLVIVGGSESLSRIAFQGFQRLYAMAETICSPFDKNRKGMLLGEGAGVMILESLEHACKRKASIYAEVLGYGLSCDAYNITIPHCTGIKKAMAKALSNCGISADSVDYISAHGTGTLANDKTESTAINAVFGKRKISVSSIKSMLGHCLGAASAIEAITCVLAMQDSLMPPTMNFTTPDPECDIDCVPNRSRAKKIKVALNNAFAFGGNNCCVGFGSLN